MTIVDDLHHNVETWSRPCFYFSPDTLPHTRQNTETSLPKALRTILFFSLLLLLLLVMVVVVTGWLK